MNRKKAISHKILYVSHCHHPILLQLLQLIHRVLQAKMGIGVQVDSYLAMAHKVLEGLGVHPRFCHIAAVGMPADVGRYAWNLDEEYLVVPVDHVLESMFSLGPYKC